MTAKLQLAQVASGLALLMANGSMVSCSAIRGSTLRVFRLRCACAHMCSISIDGGLITSMTCQ